MVLVDHFTLIEDIESMRRNLMIITSEFDFSLTTSIK